MKFAAFEDAYQAAKDKLRCFQGDDNWPGLTEHDRVYALPVDWKNEDYTAIVRAHRLQEHESSPIPVEIWYWHWAERGHGKAAKLSMLSPKQLAAVAEIKLTVRSWIRGEIDELPPSTDRHFSKDDDR